MIVNKAWNKLIAGAHREHSIVSPLKQIAALH